MSDPTSIPNTVKESEWEQDRLRDLFDQVTELPPAERGDFLASACRGDSALRQEVESLLATDADTRDDDFWQRSALHNQVIEYRAATSAVGETVGSYRLVELIGRGGMGAVYRAVRVDAGFNQSVAVKLIDAIFYTSDIVAQFRAERQILANLNHPNIACLLDGGERSDGLPYLVMEFVEGISPYNYCAQHNLSTTGRLQLFRQICSAVHSAHQNMVIHRDLKPANILVTSDGTPKLLDFGIAKVLSPDPARLDEALTRPGMLKMTARYASPEQVLGQTLTTASDVYSLGVILYELLAGHSPYGDADRPTHQIVHSVCEEVPERPSVWVRKLKGDLDNIVLHALRKSPHDRYASADQFSEDLLRFLEGRPVHARGDAPLYVAAKFVQRNRIGVAAAGLLLCTLIGGLVAVNLARARAERRFNELHQLAHSVVFDYSDAIDRLPGSTPVRERLVKDALTYLDSLSKEANTPELQREIVDSYVRVSNVQGNEYQSNLGNTAGALASSQKATAAAEQMLKRDKSLAALDSAASAFSTQASLLYSSGDLSAADIAYQRALGLRQEIGRQAPEDIPNQIALATCLNHLGDLYGGYGFQNLGKTSESLAYYGQAKALVLNLISKLPADVDIAKESYETLLSISSAEGAVGKHDEAAKDLGDALAQIEKVRLAQPHDTNVRYELANGESRLGQILLDYRGGSAAVPHLVRSAELIQSLLQDDAGNANFRRAQSVVEGQWAAALRGAGQALEGVSHNEKALRLAQSLSHDSPKSAQYSIDVGITERKLSEGLLAAGDTPGALRHAQEAAQILCRDDSTARNSNTLANCGRAELAIGRAYLALHNSQAAIAALSKAEAISSQQSLSDPGSTVFRSDLARSQASLAAALVQAGDTKAAGERYQAALGNWSKLAQAKSISLEDAHRSEDGALALAHLRPPK